MDAILIVSSVALWVTVIFNLLLTLALIRKVNSSSQFSSGMPMPEMLEMGVEAPEFFAETLNGRKVTHADYIGKDLAMVFVASDCGPCRDKMTELQELYPKAQKSGVELMIVNLENLAKTQAFTEELHFDAPVLSAPRGENPLDNDYKVHGTPWYYAIDQEGKIISGGFLDNTWQELISKWQ